jgi:SAM-dependent methyltransferase
MTKPCLFCNSVSTKIILIPKNNFNAKVFSYLKCKNCNLVFIDPIPTDEDLELMYPPSYQQGVAKQTTNNAKKMPGLRFPYLLHLDLLKKNGAHKKIVDFGCGNGHFIYNALQQGIVVNGVEFSAKQVTNLQNEIKETSFYTVKEFYEKDITYDAIFMSNVLEHFTNPKKEFELLLKKLNTNGIVLIEGPLEMNKSLVNTFKWLYFKIRLSLNKNYKTNHTPTHIFFSNHLNQLNFFKSHNLQTEYYKIAENTWPYPEKISEVKSAGDLVKYFIGQCSRFMSLFISNFGNTFIYVGRKIN